MSHQASLREADVMGTQAPVDPWSAATLERAREAVRRVVAHGLDLPDGKPFEAIVAAAMIAGANPGKFADALEAAHATQLAMEATGR